MLVGDFNQKCIIEWKVMDYELLLDGDQVESPSFIDYASKTKWHFSLENFQLEFLESSNVYRIVLNLYLHLDSPGSVQANLNIAVVDREGRRSFESQQNLHFTENLPMLQISTIDYEKLWSDQTRWFPDGHLKLHCEINFRRDPLVDNLKYPSEPVYQLGAALRAKGHFDLTLVADGKEIFVHRLVLATVSPVFAAMFEHDTKEKHQNRVVIEDIKIETLQLLVDYVYEGQLVFEDKSLDEVENLLMAADKYQIDVLRNQCVRDLASRLKSTTAARLLTIADRLHLSQLYTDVLQLIKREPLAVITSAEWIQHQNEVFKKALQALNIEE